MVYFAPTNNSLGLQLFKEAAQDFDGILFAYFFQEQEELVVYKPFDEERVVLKENLADNEKMRTFIYEISIPSFWKFDELALHLIFNAKDLGLFLFVNESEESELALE